MRKYVCGAEAFRDATALRLPAGDRWHAEIVGGAEGAVAKSGGQAAGGADGGSSAGVRRLRGENSGGQLRRGNGDGVGPRDVCGGEGSGQAASYAARRTAATGAWGD